MESAVKSVAKAYNLNADSLYHKTKQRHIAEPRMLTISLLLASGEYTNKELSEKFNLQPQTITHARHTIRCLIQTNAVFRRNVTEILKEIYLSKKRREHIVICLMRH